MSLPLPKFTQSRVIVIGDIMLDRYWTGDTSRISPEAPVPIVKVGDIEDRLGGAANVAKNVAALGCETAICGIVGNDQEAAIIKRLLMESSIEEHTIVDIHNPTITKLRILSRHQQLIRMDFEEHLSRESCHQLTEKTEKIIAASDVDAVIVSDYAKGTVIDPSKVIAFCRSRRIPVLVDPKGIDFNKYRGASLVTPNLSELEAIVGKCTDLNDILGKAERLRQDIDLDGILVTLSEKGMVLVHKNHAPTQIATSAKDVFDVTGAGDTAIATLASAIASGASYINAMKLANVAAGIVVGKLGTSTVSVAELRGALNAEDRDIEKGIMSLDMLIRQIGISRSKSEKIVFTNGCFDILHAGHVRYLKKAAELGDRLIVAMNSDESISRLKGNERPIVSLQERMEVMASLNCVDWVVPFEDDTPLSLITRTAPDILVKGGDYAAEEIVGYERVKAAGGEVTVIPFVEGCSTTSIIDKIKSLA